MKHVEIFERVTHSCSRSDPKIKSTPAPSLFKAKNDKNDKNV